MAAETSFYNLYKVCKGPLERLVIVKAIRPDFANYDGAQEEAAWTELEDNRRATISNYCNKNGYERHDFLAEWMDYPVGEIFYADDTEIKVQVWIAMHNQGKPYFAFGECDTEENFWSELENDYNDGDCYIFPSLVRPAQSHSIIYVQQKT